MLRNAPLTVAKYTAWTINNLHYRIHKLSDLNIAIVCLLSSLGLNRKCPIQRISLDGVFPSFLPSSCLTGPVLHTSHKRSSAAVNLPGSG